GRGRSAAAVPDLAGHADAVLPRSVAPGPHLVAPPPVRFGAAGALRQVLRGERPVVNAVRVGVVPPPELQRIDVELRGKVVGQRLQTDSGLSRAKRPAQR